jgi:hypothetical protein
MLAAVPPLRLYTVFHLNLAFSSVPEEERPTVLARCYWPLLRLCRRLELPLGVELSGYTLRALRALDPAWVDELGALVARGLVEVVASGRAQLIGPLVPWRVNAANLQVGLADYRAALGVTPTTLLVNEQAFSRAAVDHALDAGLPTVVLEWENAWRANPGWDRRWAYAPQRVAAADGRTATVLWNHGIAFQKVQRFVHGELELADLLGYVEAQRGPEPRAFCLYGNDAEVFDYRPGRFDTEARLEHAEWDRLGELFEALRRQPWAQFAPPTAVAAEPGPLGGHLLTPQGAAEPVPTKKQGKYNVTRWAVTGRDDLGINTRCQRLHDALVASEVPLDDPRWAELCELWGSDYRTHITDARWEAYLRRLAAAERAAGVAAPAGTAAPGDVASAPAAEGGRTAVAGALPPGVTVERGRRFLRVATPELVVLLDTRKGLCLEEVGWPRWSPRPVAGTIPHGFLDDARWSADWFSGHLVFEAPGKPKVTDLERVEPTVTVEADAVRVTACIPTPLGPVHKTITVPLAGERLALAFALAWPELPVGSLRLGHVLLAPGAWNAHALRYRTHLGGVAPEEFRCGDASFDHGDPVSFLVSASTAVGMTEGVLELGDDARWLRICIPRGEVAAVGSITHRVIAGVRFFRFCASLREMDETTRKALTHRREPLRLSMTLEPGGA